MSKIGFGYGKGKNYILCCFSSVYAFKQAKAHILFMVQPLKMFNKKIVVLILGVQAKLSEALHLKSRQL